jgi:hypothetical protein
MAVDARAYVHSLVVDVVNDAWLLCSQRRSRRPCSASSDTFSLRTRRTTLVDPTTGTLRLSTRFIRQHAVERDHVLAASLCAARDHRRAAHVCASRRLYLSYRMNDEIYWTRPILGLVGGGAAPGATPRSESSERLIGGSRTGRPALDQSDQTTATRSDVPVLTAVDSFPVSGGSRMCGRRGTSGTPLRNSRKSARQSCAARKFRKRL